MIINRYHDPGLSIDAMRQPATGIAEAAMRLLNELGVSAPLPKNLRPATPNKPATPATSALLDNFSFVHTPRRPAIMCARFHEDCT